MAFDGQTIARDLDTVVREVLAGHDPESTDPEEFLGVRFDAGLAWVQFPEGHGGLGVPQSFQQQVNAALAAAGAPAPEVDKNGRQPSSTRHPGRAAAPPPTHPRLHGPAHRRR
jgi:hypothetical protein